jgi:hypothetical protein
MKLPFTTAASTAAGAVVVCILAAAAVAVVAVVANIVRGQRSIDFLLAPPAAEGRAL